MTRVRNACIQINMFESNSLRYFTEYTAIFKSWNVCLGKNSLFSMTGVTLLCDKNHLESPQQPFLWMVPSPQSSKSLLLRIRFQETDRLLLIHGWKFIYDWKTIHITHLKNTTECKYKVLFLSSNYSIGSSQHNRQ